MNAVRRRKRRAVARLRVVRPTPSEPPAERPADPHAQYTLLVTVYQGDRLTYWGLDDEQPEDPRWRVFSAWAQHRIDTALDAILEHVDDVDVTAQHVYGADQPALALPPWVICEYGEADSVSIRNDGFVTREEAAVEAARLNAEPPKPGRRFLVRSGPLLDEDLDRMFIEQEDA